MSEVRKAIKLALHAIKIAEDTQKNTQKYLVITGYDSMWKDPVDTTMIFYAVVHDNENTPVHVTSASYSQILNPDLSLGQFFFNKSKAIKYAKKASNLFTEVHIMSIDDFKHRFHFLSDWR